MQTYRYEGISASGAGVKGIVEAIDEQEALILARANCRTLLSIKPETKVRSVMNTDLDDLLGGGRIKDKQLSLLCSQLAIELKAGLSLVRALELVAKNESNAALKKIITESANDVRAGHTLSEALSLHGPKLPKTLIETVRAGEESGKLDECFERLKVYYKSSGKIKSKVASAMVYPVMLIIVAVIVVAIIMIKAVPVFEASFAGLGQELPGVTKALIATSHFFKNNILLLLVGALALALALKLYGQTESGKNLYARLALSFPGLGLVNRMNGASQFASTMGTMLAAGLPMVKAARITSNVVSNHLIKKDVQAASDGVITGRSLGDGLSKSLWLPPLLLEMTAVGEETGNLEETLDVINEYYTDEVNLAVDRALGILEPAITIIMALLVVFILLSVYLPLFSMYQ